jgi:very-short-patch-repair endonuclease
MELPAYACPASNQWLSSRQQLLTAGITRRGLQDALARGDVIRVRRGVYSRGSLPPVAAHLLTGGLPDAGYLARTRALLLSLGPGCRAARRTAAVLWGFDLAVEPTGVEVDVPEGRGRVRVPDVLAVRRPVRVVVHRRVLGFDPIPTTCAVQTVLDCAAALPLHEAVVVADSALRSRAVSLPGLRRAAEVQRGQPGAKRIRRVLRLADPRSGSVLESLLRVLLTQAGLPRPESQFHIGDRSRGIHARVDFCWPVHRLVVECDGRRWHDPDDARNRDRRRDNGLERLSWRLLRFTWAEVVHDPDHVIDSVRDCLAGWCAVA